MELISVIIPTYNRAEKLVQSVVSVLNQDYDNFEVIVVDDAGDDDTEERIRKLEDNRVRYIRLDENGGPSKARNAGVSAANGNIIAFHDSDDTCHRNRLSIQYKYLKEHPEFNIVYSRYNIFLDGELSGTNPPMDTELIYLEGHIYQFLLQQNFIGCPTVMMYKETFKRVDGFNEKMRCIEDWDFAVRVSKDNKIGFINEPTLDVNISSTGVSGNSKNYYDARSKMIASEKGELERLGLLNKVLSDYLTISEKSGYLEYAKLVLMRELMLTSGISYI